MHREPPGHSSMDMDTESSGWDQRMEVLYRALFRSQQLLGNWPLVYDESEGRVKYLGRRGGWWSGLFMLNCCLYPLFFFKHVHLLIRCYTNQNYETGFELLIFWALGSFFFLTTFVNQVYYRKDIPQVISAWLRFEKHVQEFGPALDEKQESRRKKLFCFEALFFSAASSWVPVFAGVLHTLFPRLPCFFYSALPKSLDAKPEFWYRRLVIQGVCSIFEMYMALSGCTIIFATYLLLSLISQRISVTIAALSRSHSMDSHLIANRQQLNILSTYRSAQVLLRMFHETYAVFISTAGNIALLLLITSCFAAMRPNTHPFLRFVMGSLAVIACVDTLTFLLPLAGVVLTSRRFLDSNALGKEQKRTCPELQINPGGYHKITHSSVLQLFLLAVSFVQLLFSYELRPV